MLIVAHFGFSPDFLWIETSECYGHVHLALAVELYTLTSSVCSHRKKIRS